MAIRGTGLEKDSLIYLLSQSKKGSPEYVRVNRAMQSSLPFYTDPSTEKKYYKPSANKLLGGGPAGSKEAREKCSIKLKGGSTLSVERDGQGELVATLFLPGGQSCERSSEIIVNGQEVKLADLISLFGGGQQTPPLWKAKYDGGVIHLSSRDPTAPLMIKQGVEKGPNPLEWLLDEAYIECCLVPDNQMEAAIKKFVVLYKNLLDKAQWSEEQINIRIRKATVDALSILLIPQWKQFMGAVDQAFQEVITQFKKIEKEIQCLNLSLGHEEALDFHLYRGFIFSKLPVSSCREERYIAVADGMILISMQKQLLEEGKSSIFYKKFAHGCKVFAKGANNPEVSFQFIALGLQLVDRSRSLGFKDVMLDQIEKELKGVKEVLGKPAEQIDLELLEDSSAHEEVKDQPVESLAQEKMDKILLRTFQDIPDPKQLIDNLKRSIEAYQREIKKEEDIIQRFRIELRRLFLSSYLTFLTGYQEPATLVKKYSQLKEDLNQLEQKIPNDLRARAEFHLFRGSIFITYPRRAYGEKGDRLEYDIAIADFNQIKKMGVFFPKDIRGFQYMTYGEHMLNYDPLKAMRLLRAASSSAYCENIKKKSQLLLDQFFKSFNPVRPSIGFDLKQLQLT